MDKFKKTARKDKAWSLRLDDEISALMSEAVQNGYDVPAFSREALREAFRRLKAENTKASEPKAS